MDQPECHRKKTTNSPLASREKLFNEKELPVICIILFIYTTHSACDSERRDFVRVDVFRCNTHFLWQAWLVWNSIFSATTLNFGHFHQTWRNWKLCTKRQLPFAMLLHKNSKSQIMKHSTRVLLFWSLVFLAGASFFFSSRTNCKNK